MEFDDRRLIASIVEGLRRKLIDTSKRNRMLNFRHDERSRSQIRIVATGLDSVYAALVRDGVKLTFRGLPPFDDEPDDEKTNVFRLALARARAADQEYASRRATLGDEATRAARRKLERWLRDRVRAELGMGEAPAQPQRPADHARRCGIDPSHDLVGDAAGPAGVLQTLLWHDRVDAKLRGLAANARLAQQETGLGSLFAAFGFLEWYEDEASEVRLTSPLLLQPVAMTRRKERGRDVHELEAADEEQAERNLALGERLESFGLLLPLFDASAAQPVERWLREVEKLVADRPGWRVRRQLTITQLSFARYVMYRDLDPAAWPEGRGPAEHPLVPRVLRGDPSATEPGIAAEYEVETPEVERLAPVLVRDADSSQHSAIVDAMTGRNLVIEGPPGTGKSQTITNLIANALHAGKTVLFVAEKLAALEVVKNRLDDVGLGPFCLELHSAKSGPKAVIGQLRERLDMERPIPPRLLDARLSELHAKRRQLADYVAAVNRPADGEASTVHELIWRERRLSRELGDLAAHSGPLAQPALAVLGPAQIAELRSAADRLARLMGDLAEAPSDEIADPWRFLPPGRQQASDVPEIAETVQGLADVLDEIGPALRRNAASFHDLAEPSLEALSRRAERMLALPSATEGLRYDLLRELAEPGAAEAVEKVVRARSSLELAESTLRNALRAGARPPLAAVADVERLTSEIGGTGTVSQARERVAELREAARGLDDLAATVARAAVELGLAPPLSVDQLDALLATLEAVAAAPSSTLAARRPGLAGGVALLRAAQAEANRLAEERDALGRMLDLASVPWAECEAVAAALERDGLLARFSPASREAEARVRPWLRGSATRLTRHAQAGLLRRARAWREGCHALAADPRLRSLLGPGWGGIDADFDAYAAAARWSGEIEERLGREPRLLPLLRAIQGWSSERLLTIARDPGTLRALRQLGAVLRSAPDGTLAEELGGHLGRDADRLERLAEAAAAIGLAADYPLAELDRVAAALAKAEEAERELGEIGAAYAGEADLGPTLALARAITDARLPPALTAALLSHRYMTARASLAEAAGAIERLAATASDLLALLASRHGADWRTVLDGSDAREAPLERLRAAARAASGRAEELHAGARLEKARRDLAALGLMNATDALRRRATPAAAVSRVIELARARSVLRAARQDTLVLDELDGLQLGETRARFAELDRELMAMQARLLASRLADRRMPAGVAVGPKSGWTEAALVSNELTKQKRFAPVRDLLARSGTAVRALKPCFLMSPLSVAQFIKPSAPAFDLLVMDEASQMLPEDALGSLLRAGQVVVVGDPRQLPPTDFFDRNDRTADDDEDPLADEQVDAESILDLCRTTFRPARRLRWHYRSRHESLIAFANKEHYADQPLITFPAAEQASEFLGLELASVAGRYEGRVNEPEARALVAAARDVARRRPDLSMAVVAVNQPQRELLEELLAAEEAVEPALAAYREAWEQGIEPLIVKNLENIQGDERDVVLVSLVYGPNEAGKVYQRFGPIAGRYGHRRLNVLFTRARRKMVVFSSLRPDDVLVSAESKPGVRVLREYLRYAASGQLHAGSGRSGEPESDFEASVATALRDAGHVVDCQVGVAGYRLDLAVRHPSQPWRYLLGVECDGAAYHSAKSVRDRDRLRQDVLEALGWRVYRIWSTDWSRNPVGETARLLAEVERLSREGARAITPAARLVEPQPATIVTSQQPVVPEPAPELEAETEAADDAPLAGSSLEARLRHYREATIMRDLPGSEPGRCLLRDAMIDVMVTEGLDDPADFTKKVPRSMRESTDGRQMRYLTAVCEMISEVGS